MSAPAQEVQGPLGSERVPHAQEPKLRDRLRRRSLPQACGSLRLSAGTQGRGTPVPATYADHRAQLKAILCGWGMPEDNAEITAEVLAWSDLHGVDSHGISMIPRYDELRRNGRVRMDARPRIVSQTPVSAVVDGGGGLGHVPAHFAMSTAIAKAKTVGMAAAVVRALGAFRCSRVLHADGRRRRSRRHGLHVCFEHPGGADVRETGAARHRSLVVRGPQRRRRAVPARHGDDDGRRGPYPQQGQREASRPPTVGCWTAKAAPPTIRWWPRRRAGS